MQEDENSFYKRRFDACSNSVLLKDTVFIIFGMLLFLAIHLECKHLISQLADRLCLLESKVNCCLLHGADHWWWTTKQELDIAGWLGEVFLFHELAYFILDSAKKVAAYGNHLWSNKSNTTSPLLRRVVQNILNSESLVRSRQIIQVLLQQNILLVDVCENQINLRLVARWSAPNNCADDLQHWCDASSSCDHTEMTDKVGRVYHGSLWSLDLDRLADFEGSHEFGDVTGGVGFDEEVEVTWVVVPRDGSV